MLLISLILCSFCFLSLPFAVSIAATVQINQQLARKYHSKARLTAYFCLLVGTVSMTLIAVGLYELKDYVGYLFTTNEDIIGRVRSMAGYAAGFQVAYGVYGSAQGVLRATSHQFDMLG